MIDLRSDTVTRPTPAMRAAMAQAPVGDMQYGDDPTLNALEERVAALLGKEASLWLPSGTMANQVALRVLTRPGDDVLIASEAHSAWHETGGSAANAGVQCTEIPGEGLFTAADVRRMAKPQDSPVLPLPPTTLVQIENTHNRHGGRVFPPAQVEAICATARELRLATYLDGARLWNACAVTGQSHATACAPFDLVMVAFSKGLGAPAGSILAGPRDLISRAIRQRRMLGGAMRQVGMFAAACDHALTHHLARLPEDHANARRIAQRLAACPGVKIALDRVETNIVVFELESARVDAPGLVQGARARGVLINALGPTKLRLVTHLDVSGADCDRAAAVLVEILDGKV
ncbi:MAG: aminotransferase class I/II-fold pyridoxal phosphate-dependent enzyme [Burkholderiales bacterium]|nr:aminotransferase class I/II-fold pyridoxal phosphate-dependent enzyme [Burkholderiales bacterium]